MALPARFIMCLAFTLVHAPDIHAQEPSLRVMTFNIRYNTPKDGNNAWKHRKDRVAAIFRTYDVALGGLQEPDKKQIKDLKSRLPEYEWIGVKNAVYYRKDRLERLGGSTFWLSKTPDKSSRGWDAQQKRLVRWVKFRDRVTGSEFYLFNTHFDHRGKKAREKSAKLILKKITEIAGEAPVILIGDFNCERSSVPYKRLTAAGDTRAFRDAVKLAARRAGPEATFNNFKTGKKPKRAIDFIFVRNVGGVLRHAVVDEMTDGRYPSDHFPVVADVVEHEGRKPAAK